MNSIKKNLSIKEAIITTIAFFDIFQFPLTETEIWKFFPIKIKLSDLHDELRELREQFIIIARGGYYYLAQSGENIEKRRRRYYYSDRKIRRARRIMRIFKFIPWIKMLGLGNMMGTNNLKNESDIDVFIVAEPKRVWLTRFFCVGIIKLFGLRPRPEMGKDKICLSFYIASDNLDMQSLMLDNGLDYYFVYWLANLVVLYDKRFVYEKLIRSNSWINELLPNWEPQLTSKRRIVKSWEENWYHDIIDMLVGGLDGQVGSWQKRKFPPEIKNEMNKNKKVIVNDQVLKLHVNDRREKFRRLLREKLGSLNVEIR